MRRLLCVGLLGFGVLTGCGDDAGETDSTTGESADGDAGDGGGDGDGDGDTPDLPPAGPAEGEEFLHAIGGLWTGPVTMTPLGDFVFMNMDVRATDERVLFSRVDLDAANNLRFAFQFEEHGGVEKLVYRNGGYFLGVLRDSRAELVSADADAGIWRFCSIPMGCDYIDAVFEITGDDLLLDVKVKGMQHVYWLASRVEPSTVPDGFPADGPAGDGTQPFPDMPSLRTSVTWTAPLLEDGDVWVLLANQDCPLSGLCDLSRFISIEAPAGATSAEVLFDQIHPGEYKATAILDRDRNLGGTLLPGTGDGVSLPNQAIDVGGSGQTTASIAILIDL